MSQNTFPMLSNFEIEQVINSEARLLLYDHRHLLT